MAEYIDYKTPKIKVKFFKFGKYKFSTIELKHLTIAMTMIILTIFVFNNQNLITLENIFQLKTLKTLGIYAVTVGLGFLLHELGHKLVAQHYGFISEFRADFQMLFFMFALAIFAPIIFLAPGAVMILGRPSIKQNGIISVAGPLVNLALATTFFITLILSTNETLSLISIIGVQINAFLGIFNMLPFWVLDGKKVLKWSKLAYFLTLLPLLAYFLLFFLI